MTFGSVYQIFNRLDELRNQRFWTWFSGDDLNAYWTKTNFQDTGTFTMIDAVDGGFSITGGNSALDSSGITFNDIRQFSPTASTCIFIMKRNTNNVVNLSEAGFYNNFAGNRFVTNSTVRENSGATFKALVTDDGTTGSVQDSDVPVDINFTGYKIENGLDDIKLTINGVLKVTKTTNRPNQKMQPLIAGTTGFGTSVAFGTSIRYYEAFNT